MDVLPVTIVVVFLFVFGSLVWALQISHRPTDDLEEIVFLSPPRRRQPRPELRPQAAFENHLPFIPNPPSSLSGLSLPPTPPPSPILFGRDSATVSIIESRFQSPLVTPTSTRCTSDYTISALSTSTGTSDISFLEITNPHIGEIVIEDVPAEQDITEADPEV